MHQIDPRLLKYMEFYNRGIELMNSTHWEAAAKSFQQALVFVSQDSRAHVQSGHCYLELNQPVRAIEELQTASELDPKDSVSWYLLGLAYIADRKNDKAAACCSRLRDTDPARAAKLSEKLNATTAK